MNDEVKCSVSSAEPSVFFPNLAPGALAMANDNLVWRIQHGPLFSRSDVENLRDLWNRIGISLDYLEERV
jgi:hypothetical protein